MSNQVRIAGVSVDAENPPTREQLFAQAMITKGYRDNPFAKQEINQEIRKSGLYPAAPIQPKKSKPRR